MKPRGGMRLGGLCIVLGVLAAVPAAAQTPVPKGATEYVVKPGETLGGVANRSGVPRAAIIEANGLKEPYLLRAGQKLVIPRRRTHTIKAGETSFSIAMDFGMPWPEIALANKLDPRAEVRPGQVLAIPALPASAPPQIKAAPLVAAPAASAAPTPLATAAATPAASPAPAVADETRPPAFSWPVKGDVRRAFAARGEKSAYHDGVDIRAGEGTPVRSSAAGKVIFAGAGPREYGLTVIIHHAGRWTTTYGFLGRVTVKLGDEVKAGERVGLVGKTGLATEPQLHFEVRNNKAALDPAKFLPKR